MPDEAAIIRRESGGKPFVGWTGVDLTDAPRDAFGFPIWEGRMGPQGMSHAAGLYQFEPSTWREGAAALGIKDFSPGSQKQVYDYIHAKYGDAPWKASEPQMQREGVYGGATHLNVHALPGSDEQVPDFGPVENALLYSILQSRYPEEAPAPVGNPILDGLLNKARGEPLDAGKVPGGYIEPQQETRAVEPPKAAAIASTPEPIAARPLATPAPGITVPQTVPGTQDNPLIQPGPGGAPVGARDVPGSADRNRFFNPSQIAPYNPPGVADDRIKEAKTGNDVLDRLLTAAGTVPGRETDVQQAQREQTAAQQPRQPLVGVGEGGALTGRIADLAEAVTPFLAGGAPGGSVSAGIRLPRGGGYAQDLISFLNSKGGLKETGDLRAMDLHKLPGVGRNRLLRPSGLSLDYAREAAEEAGYLNSGSDISDLLEALDRSARGTPIYPAEMRPEIRDAQRREPQLPLDPFDPSSMDFEGQEGSIGRVVPTSRGAASRVEPPPIREVSPAAGGSGPPAIPPTGLSRVPGAEPPRGEPPLYRDVSATVDEPRPRKGDSGESAAVKKMRLDAMHLTQDKLFKRWTQSEEYKDRLLTMMKELPQLSPEQKLQAERYLEWQPGMPQVAIDGETLRMVAEVIKPAQRRAAADYAWLKSKGAVEHIDEATEKELTEGYLHRIAANKGAPGTHPFQPLGGVKSLRRSTSSMKARQLYAIQNKDGERVIMRGEAPEYGSKVRDTQGREWEVRRATTEEIEKNTDIRYLHDPVLASLQNMAQLHIARENVELLTREILPELVDSGLATTSRDAARRLGFEESQIPALRGHFFEKRLADAFDDFYKTPSIINEEAAGPLSVFGAMNRFAVNAMFLNPFGHMRNVLSDAVLARGDLWYQPAPYAALARSLKLAWNDMWNMTPFYRDVMKAGGSTMGAGYRNSVAYSALLDRARRDMVKLPGMEDFARTTGIWKSAAEMATAVWHQSQKFMWGFHDMLLLQHVRELTEKGMPLEQAVQRAERFIADYRVPATIGEGGKIDLPYATARAMSRWMQDRTITVFGRYHYNKLKAIGNTLADAGRALTRSGMSGAERKEALGRLATMLLWSSIFQAGINFIVQQATGNPYASAHVPGAMGIPANAAKVANDIFRGQMGEAGYDAWMGLLSIISPLPAVAEGISQMTNTNFPVSSAPIAGSQLPWYEQMAQRGVHAAGSFLEPLGELLSPRKLLSSTAGISLPNPAAVAKAQKPHPAQRRAQQRAFDREFALPWSGR